MSRPTAASMTDGSGTAGGYISAVLVSVLAPTPMSASPELLSSPVPCSASAQVSESASAPTLATLAHRQPRRRHRRHRHYCRRRYRRRRQCERTPAPLGNASIGVVSKAQSAPFQGNAREKQTTTRLTDKCQSPLHLLCPSTTHGMVVMCIRNMSLWFIGKGCTLHMRAQIICKVHRKTNIVCVCVCVSGDLGGQRNSPRLGSRFSPRVVGGRLPQAATQCFSLALARLVGPLRPCSWGLSLPWTSLALLLCLNPPQPTTCLWVTLIRHLSDT